MPVKLDFRVLGVLSLLIMFVIVGRLYIPCCNADLQWYDDFDDGDCTGWTVSLCSAEDGSLRATDSPAMAYRASSITSGTWSFDLEHLAWSEANRPSGQLSTYVYNSIIFFMSTDPDVLPRQFYCLVSGYAILDDKYIPAYTLRKSAGFGGDIGAWPLLSSWDGLEFSWYHFDITRSPDGEINVFMNGTHVTQIWDTDINKSDFFIYSAYQNRALDDVVVSDTIDIVPAIPPFWVIGVIGGMFILMVIAWTAGIRIR